MEKAGTGIKRVSNACVDNGNEINFEFSDSFWVTMKTNNKDRVIDKVPDKVPDNLTENQQKILKLVAQNKNVSMSEIAENIGISKRKVLDNINKLKNRGLIQRIGPPKGGHWEINK